MAAGLMISFGPGKGGGKGDKPKGDAMPMADEENDENDELDGSPEQAALEGLKAALDKSDPALLVKAFKLLQRCCAKDEGDEEAPASEEY